ncbi:thioredoxin [Sporosarcina sp. BI001-red]|uniref:thioredoxin family protein n=1 Tax=Sporosarcina sp. BI001-red TaxID=2282866 RepID=UPI000E26041C|nr:thioredoxin domain-containing protein [Sporosarcina sp. BI001-red]REB07420.1 thioredoxin [Sporosarcina sp. BI001-red]
MGELRQVSKEDFNNEVLNSKVPVVIDFTTDGCGPCELIVPILKDIDEKYTGKLKIIQHNVDLDDLMNEANDHVKTYDVMGFPTIVIVKDGKAVDNILGIYDQEEIERRVQQVL